MFFGQWVRQPQKCAVEVGERWRRGYCQAVSQEQRSVGTSKIGRDCTVAATLVRNVKKQGDPNRNFARHAVGTSRSSITRVATAHVDVVLHAVTVARALIGTLLV